MLIAESLPILITIFRGKLQYTACTTHSYTDRRSADWQSTRFQTDGIVHLVFQYSHTSCYIHGW